MAQNKNHGDAFTEGLRGKRASFYGEPQLWLTVIGGFSVGTKVNLYYHVLTYDETIQAYPTLAVRYRFQ